MTRRIKRINQLMKEEISKILLREAEFPKDVLVTVTRVETTPDLNESKVFISVVPEEKEKKVIEDLERKIYSLQQKINKKLNMRKIPRIEFLKEEKTKEAGKIEAILEKLKKKEK